ncbi:MAG: hypothetical protein IKI08_02145 [Selenomonadaceae bacterium]|nr:hypothetical protein [Selenomonadaceae bacterium]
MTNQEKINQALQRQIDAQNVRFDTVLTKVDALINESNQQREDIRRINEKIDAKFDKLSEQIHTMTIAAVVGFGAIAVAIGGLVVSALK